MRHSRFAEDLAAKLGLGICDQSQKYTRGSETSQYPEEQKPIGISLVAASEREEAQTDAHIVPCEAIRRVWYVLGVVRQR